MYPPAHPHASLKILNSQLLSLPNAVANLLSLECQWEFNIPSTFFELKIKKLDKITKSPTEPWESTVRAQHPVRPIVQLSEQICLFLSLLGYCQ